MDWSGPRPTSPNLDPDPLTGRFQISAYDLTKPIVTWQAPAAQAMCRAQIEETSNSGAVHGEGERSGIGH